MVNLVPCLYRLEWPRSRALAIGRCDQPLGQCGPPSTRNGRLQVTWAIGPVAVLVGANGPHHWPLGRVRAGNGGAGRHGVGGLKTVIDRFTLSYSSRSSDTDPDVNRVYYIFVTQMPPEHRKALRGH